MSIYIYIYIYNGECVCDCVCVFAKISDKSLTAVNMTIVGTMMFAH